MTPDEVVAQVPRLEALPESYQRLHRVADHPHATAADVAETLSLDQGLATRCLRLANSRDWPQWESGSEFAAARHASNDQRAN